MRDIGEMSIPLVEDIIDGIARNNKKANEAYENGGTETKAGQDALAFLMNNKDSFESGLG
jgi:hypothetical protein